MNHDYLSEFDSERAFARTYELYQTMNRQFRNKLSEVEKLDFDVNFLESRFTTGHHADVAPGQQAASTPH